MCVGVRVVVVLSPCCVGTKNEFLCVECVVYMCDASLCYLYNIYIPSIIITCILGGRGAVSVYE